MTTVNSSDAASDAHATRDVIFISHANPEDNAFTLWIGAKLSALGYAVWADILRLTGGEDWQRNLETALRCRSCKVLLVGTPSAVKKQGVRNEIQIASEVAKRIGDTEFIIPLRLEPYDAPFLIAHAQYIDFQRGWSRAFIELLDAIENKYRLPRSEDTLVNYWHHLQSIHANNIISDPEPLISNWVTISRLPQFIIYYDFRGPINIDDADAKISDAPWPVSHFHRGFLSFAMHNDLHNHFGPNLPIETNDRIPVEEFLVHGWPALEISRRDALNRFSDMARQSLEALFTRKGLKSYKLSSGRLAWWMSHEDGPRGRVRFKWDSLSGTRALQGESLKLSIHWHYGVSVKIKFRPIQCIEFVHRLIFTSDGTTPLGSPKRMHRLRRSFAKDWRNARWRDMYLAFLYWLSDGSVQLLVPVSNLNNLVLDLPPFSLTAPVSIRRESDDGAQSGDDLGEYVWGDEETEYSEGDHDDE